MGQNTAFGVDHIPPKVCELLQTSGWRKFVVPYFETVVEYGENDFERFVQTKPPNGLGQNVEKDSVHLTAPARNIEYVAALALGWPVKPDKAEATYEHGLLRIEVPFKDPMEGAVKIAIKAGGAEAKTKTIESK
jgi:hypothetical protein